MRRATGLAVLLAVTTAAAAGYGGFDFGGSLLDFGPEVARLDELNRKWDGRQGFRSSPALFWLGGHGGGSAGSVTIGGRGALSYRHLAADAVAADFAAALVALELGWQYSPVEGLVLTPGLELGGASWCHYVHDRGSPFTDPDFGRWYASWSVGVMPAFEVFGRLSEDLERYSGVFVKAGYSFPVYGSDWYVDRSDPPAPGLELRGFEFRVGMRFGRLPPAVLRI